MESVNARVEPQPVPQHSDGSASMTSFNFDKDPERRSLGAPSPFPESFTVGTSCSKKHVSIAAAAAHARITTFVILAISAVVYLLVNPV